MSTGVDSLTLYEHCHYSGKIIKSVSGSGLTEGVSSIYDHIWRFWWPDRVVEMNHILLDTNCDPTTEICTKTLTQDQAHLATLFSLPLICRLSTLQLYWLKLGFIWACYVCHILISREILKHFIHACFEGCDLRSVGYGLISYLCKGCINSPLIHSILVRESSSSVCDLYCLWKYHTSIVKIKGF